jgi:hypothetical protein
MSSWTVLGNGPIQSLAPNLWVVRGVVPRLGIGRNMVILRLADGTLLLHSVVCLDDAGMAALDALGRPSILVVPNQGHRMDIREYKARYPNAKVIAPRNARAKVEEVIPVDVDAEAALPPLGITCHRPDGMQEGYELVYDVALEGGGRALLVNDVLGNPHPSDGFIAGLLGAPGGKLGQPRIVRWRFGKDPAAFRRFILGLADIPDLRVVTLAHGDCLTERCAERLREAVGG